MDYVMSRTQRGKGSLLKVSDDDLVRHESLSYNDGYADARANGRNGFWMPIEYSAAAREGYMQGFRKGLRVHGVIERSNPTGNRAPVNLKDLLDMYDAERHAPTTPVVESPYGSDFDWNDDLQVIHAAVGIR